MTAASGLRHCGLNKQSNGRRIEVESWL